MQPKEYINCNQEQIHLCGKIQSFGFLIGAINSKIVFCSENLSSILSIDPKDIFGKNIESFFNDFVIDINWENVSNTHELAIQHIDIKDEEYTLSIYKNGEITFYEIEKVIPNHKINLEYNAIQNILKKANDQNVWKILLKEIQAIIDFDRLMIYRFLPDNNGKIIEEVIKDNQTSFLNQYFPEFDIPSQARALYLKNTIRITSDTKENNVSIIGLEKEQIDLSYSTIRSTSPIHLEYLKNMGVTTNFSVSIIIDSKLWGMVVCHNNSFKHLDIQTRLLVDTLTRISTNAYSAFKSAQRLEDYQRINLDNVTLRQNIITEENTLIALEKNVKSIMKICNADGIIININDNQPILNGKTPKKKDLEMIISWVKENVSNFSENVFFSNIIPKTLFEKLDHPKLISGMILSLLGEDASDFIIWTREEYTQTILWAGKPEKIEVSEIKNDTETISYLPRKSFETWKQNLEGVSKKWSNKDIEAAKWFTSILLKTSHTKSTKIRNLNKQLRELNEELDSFSHTISHDLNTPLTVIKLNAQLLKRQIEVEKKANKNIDKIVDQVDTMSNMIKQVLELSRIKKSDIQLDKVELNQLLNNLSEDAKQSYACEKTEILIYETPDVLGNETMVYQVLSNIIGNAVKYSSKSENPKIIINGEVIENEIVYTITDNGIGINPEEADQVFKIFSRMSNAKDFQGNGVGLNIVYHLMEKMGGKITYISTPNVETTFILTFLKPNYDINSSKRANQTFA